MTEPVTVMNTVESALKAIASHGLPGSPPIDIDGVEPSTLVARAVAGRLTGVLMSAIALGDVELPSEDLEDLANQHQGALLWCLYLERRLLEVREWFAKDGPVDFLVVKGSAVAHLDAFDASERTFADVDLLVRGQHMDRAVRILTEQGAVRPWAERRPGFDSRFAKSVTMTFDDGMEFDLHRTLCDGVHGFRIPVVTLFQEPSHFDLGGHPIPALAPTHRLLHSAYHAMLGSSAPNLFNLRDLALAMTDVDIDVDDVLSTVRQWRGEAVLAAAMKAAFTQLTFEAPTWRKWLDAVVVSDDERRLVAHQQEDGSSFGRARMEALKELSGMRDRVAYVATWAWPSRAHLRSRGLRRRDLLGRAPSLRGLVRQWRSRS